MADEAMTLDFIHPADGVSIEQTSALLAEHDLDVQFAVQPTTGEPVGRIMPMAAREVAPRWSTPR